MKPDAQLADIPAAGRVSGISVVRALLPQKRASLEFRQSPERFLATVRLAPEVFATFDSAAINRPDGKQMP
ncbi:hypothetical protein D3C83_92790 [compost metagenome]